MSKSSMLLIERAMQRVFLHEYERPATRREIRRARKVYKACSHLEKTARLSVCRWILSREAMPEVTRGRRRGRATPALPSASFLG